MNESEAANVRSTRRTTIAAAAMLLVAFSVFGSLFYLQRQAASGPQRRTQAEVDAMYQPSEKQLEQRMAKAKWLREKWRPWALQHKDLLKAMLKAKADDTEMLNKVWDEIPRNPIVVGIKAEDLGSFKSRAGGVAWFSWNAIGKSDSQITGAQSEQERRKTLMKAERRTKQFAEVRDVMLSQATLYGSEIHVWASGRITRSVAKQKIVFFEHKGKRMRGTTLTDGPHQEIVPPYEFLR